MLGSFKCETRREEIYDGVCEGVYKEKRFRKAVRIYMESIGAVCFSPAGDCDMWRIGAHFFTISYLPYPKNKVRVGVAGQPRDIEGLRDLLKKEEIKLQGRSKKKGK